MNSTKQAGLHYPPATDTNFCPVTEFLTGLFAHCKEGKKDANLKIRSSVADIKADLNKLNKTAPQELSYEHLEAAERSLPDVAFRYAVLHKDNKPVMFVYFQVYALSAKNFNLHKDKTVIKNVMRLFLAMKKARVLVLGNALRTEAKSYCYDVNELTEQDALNALATVAERIANDDYITATLLPGMDGLRALSKRAFTRLGYSMPLEDNVMKMDIDPQWETLQDYTASLTRKYKTRANKVIEGTKELESKHLTEGDIAHYQPQINRLFAEVIDKQPFVFTTSGANYITNLKKLHKDAFEVIGFLKGDKLVAFSSAFVADDHYEVFYVGFDTDLNKEIPLYFNLLMAGLERAILLRKKELKLGRTSFDAKASLGAKPTQTDYFIKLRHIPDVALNWLVAYFSSMEDTKWKLRSPLKA